MGGLRKYMPITHATFVVATLAIAGIPGLSGFFSKDEILWNAFAGEHGSPWLWAVGAAGAGLTAFYMFRLVFLTFYGECRADHEVQHHIHESPPSMTVPLVILAVLSVVGGWVGLPMDWLWGNRFAEFLAPVLGHHAAGHHSVALELGMMGASVGIALCGIAVAYYFYMVSPGVPMFLAWRVGKLYDLVLNKYYIDELYDAMIVRPIHNASIWLWKAFDAAFIDGTVNGTARFVMANGNMWRRLQTGNVQHYALSFLLGAVALLGYYVWK
jgi:NADH-quinone oxidoreductase subunit L